MHAQKSIPQINLGKKWICCWIFLVSPRVPFKSSITVNQWKILMTDHLIWWNIAMSIGVVSSWMIIWTSIENQGSLNGSFRGKNDVKHLESHSILFYHISTHLMEILECNVRHCSPRTIIKAPTREHNLEALCSFIQYQTPKRHHLNFTKQSLPLKILLQW